MAWWERDEEYDDRIFAAAMAKIQPLIPVDPAPNWTWQDVAFLRELKIDPWERDQRGQ